MIWCLCCAAPQTFCVDHAHAIIKEHHGCPVHEHVSSTSTSTSSVEAAGPVHSSVSDVVRAMSHRRFKAAAFEPAMFPAPQHLHTTALLAGTPVPLSCDPRGEFQVLKAELVRYKPVPSLQGDKGRWAEGWQWEGPDETFLQTLRQRQAMAKLRTVARAAAAAARKRQKKKQREGMERRSAAVASLRCCTRKGCSCGQRKEASPVKAAWGSTRPPKPGVQSASTPASEPSSSASIVSVFLTEQLLGWDSGSEHEGKRMKGSASFDAGSSSATDPLSSPASLSSRSSTSGSTPVTPIAPRVPPLPHAAAPQPGAPPSPAKLKHAKGRRRPPTTPIRYHSDRSRAATGHSSVEGKDAERPAPPRRVRSVYAKYNGRPPRSERQRQGTPCENAQPKEEEAPGALARAAAAEQWSAKWKGGKSSRSSSCAIPAVSDAPQGGSEAVRSGIPLAYTGPQKEAVSLHKPIAVPMRLLSVPLQDCQHQHPPADGQQRGMRRPQSSHGLLRTSQRTRAKKSRNKYATASLTSRGPQNPKSQNALNPPLLVPAPSHPAPSSHHSAWFSTSSSLRLRTPLAAWRWKPNA